MYKNEYEGFKVNCVIIDCFIMSLRARFIRCLNDDEYGFRILYFVLPIYPINICAK